jgi:glutamate/tyrosine decarboxylase-like PLP-dependent enzyme
MGKIQFPELGMEKEGIFQLLKDMKAEDLKWQEGKAFAYIYGTEKETMQFAAEAYNLYLTENGLDPSSFPSLLKLETEVISMLADLLNGGKDACGNLTGGGTESVMLAVKTARDWARANKPEISRPEMIIPETAHPCFQKAAHYLGVDVRIIPVDKTSFKADTAAMAEAVSSQTILLVGSAPSYAHGVIDPIEELAALAKSKGLLFHVDCCVGGMYLPFAEMLGYEIPKFDFRVEGVSSISCDLHKFGYVPKGCSSVLYKNKELRQYQLFSCSSWPGYTIVNPTVSSSKTGGPMAAAWAMFSLWGKEGYKKAVDSCQKATAQFISGLKDMPEFELLGNPAMSLLSFKVVDQGISIFQLIEKMAKKGWHLQLQLASNASGEAIHLSITDFNTPHIPALLDELKNSIYELKKEQHPSNEMLMGLDASMIQLLMDNFTPDMLDNLEALLGMDISSNGGPPQDMVTVNSLLNSLKPEQRDALLKAFVNRMYL